MTTSLFSVKYCLHCSMPVRRTGICQHNNVNAVLRYITIRVRVRGGGIGAFLLCRSLLM